MLSSKNSGRSWRMGGGDDNNRKEYGKNGKNDD